MRMGVWWGLWLLCFVFPKFGWGSSFLFSEIERSPALRRELAVVVENGFRRSYGLEDGLKPPTSPFWQNSTPLFVTLKKDGKTRACMGSLQAQKRSLSEEIAHKLRLALFQDPQHRRVEREELAGIEVYLTEVRDPVLVRGIEQISPARDAVYFKQGSREAVVLPGEARTQRYLLKFLRAKARALPNQPYQIYRLSTKTLKVNDF